MPGACARQAGPRPARSHSLCLTTLIPSLLGTLLCREYTFDSYSCLPFPKLGQMASTCLRQVGKWARRVEIYPGSQVATDAQSPGLRASRRTQTGGDLLTAVIPSRGPIPWTWAQTTRPSSDLLATTLTDSGFLLSFIHIT